MSPTPASPTATTTQPIYLDLRERICLLELAPGSRLREEALATEYGVSRTPIREVLARLIFEGLVTTQPGAGATVAGIDTRALRDVWAVRLKLAELLVGFVRLPADPEILAGLDRLIDDAELVHATRDVRTLGSLYNRYHDLLLAVITNDTLRGIMDRLYHQTARVWLDFLPEMDLDTEVDLMLAELRDAREAMTHRSGERLAEVRSSYMHALLDRFNQHVARPFP
ncbi:MAG: GntR family transcriptional regulator [Nitriliruptoraceae bacterium]|nr:GntR family transcriptional regulator [Nitriliruptoraceae bacterium]